MTARSCLNLCFRAMMSLVVFVAIPGAAHAGSIVQAVGFTFQPIDTTFGSYQQFDPSLGTLSEVVIEVSGSAQAGNLTLLTSHPKRLLFRGTVSYNLGTDAGIQ